MDFYTLQLYGKRQLGRLIVDRRIFRLADTGEAWRYKGRTAFKLLEMFSRGADIAPWVRIWTSLGFNTFRVMRNKPAVPGLDSGWITPPVVVADDFIRFMASEGARVEVTLVSQVEPSLTDLPAWVEMIASHDNTFIEGVNEPGISAPKSDYLDVWNTIQPHLGVTPTASGNYTDTNPMRGSYMTFHADRNGNPPDFARKAKSALEMYDGYDGYTSPKVPVVGDEPGKPMEYGYDVPATTAHFGIYGLFVAGGTFHDLDGQFINPPTDRDYACAMAAIRGLDAFPADTPNLYSYRHDAECLADEKKTGAIRTYLTTGPYGVRCCPTDGSTTLIGV